MNNQTAEKNITLGSLGSCKIFLLEEEALDVYAKWTSSAGSFTCPDGTIVARGGPSFPDDAPLCPVMT